MSPKHGMAYEALCALNRNAIQISIYLTYCILLHRGLLTLCYSEGRSYKRMIENLVRQDGLTAVTQKIIIVSHRQKHLYLAIMLEDNLNDELDIK